MHILFLFVGLVTNLEARTDVPTVSSRSAPRRRPRKRRPRSQLLIKRRPRSRQTNKSSNKMASMKHRLLRGTRRIFGHGSCHHVVGWVRPSGLAEILRPTLVRAASWCGSRRTRRSSRCPLTPTSTDRTSWRSTWLTTSCPWKAGTRRNLRTGTRWWLATSFASTSCPRAARLRPSTPTCPRTASWWSLPRRTRTRGITPFQFKWHHSSASFARIILSKKECSRKILDFWFELYI